MKDPDAPQHEMAAWRFRSRPGHEPDEPLLDMILDGRPLPPEAPERLRTLAAGFADLGAPARSGALPGEPAALAAFRRATQAARSPATGRKRRQRPVAAAARARLAAAMTVATITVGGTAAAYAGMLPASLQDFAHRFIDAPAGGIGHHAPTGHLQPPVGPGATPGSGGGHSGKHTGHGSAPGQAKHGHHPGKPAHQVTPPPKGKHHHSARPRPSDPPSSPPPH